MGSVNSRDLISNEYLIQFSGKEYISPGDNFWNVFLSFSISLPTTREENEILDAKLAPVFSSLLTNNSLSGNFGSLLHIFLCKSTELLSYNATSNAIFLLQTYNALFILRSFTKYMVENIKDADIMLAKEFEAKPIQVPVVNADNQIEREMQGNKLEMFLYALVEILVDVPLTEYTYNLHFEVVNTLLVLLSVHMYSNQPAARSVIYRNMMHGKDSIHAPLLVKTLLGHFVSQARRPDRAGGSLVVGLASGLWHMLTLGYGAGTSVQDGAGPLANQSLLLILVLANHCTSEKNIRNPYREALFAFTNSHGPNAEFPTSAASTFKLDLGLLYNALCNTASNECTTVLLYLLLHRNENVKTLILARADIELLILPILKTLYHAADSNSHHIYMSLIILLIFSEDALFSRTIHKTMLKNITWYSERVISEISLGSLLILVVIRTIHFNMAKMRDKYLHTNCLAALANMSCSFSHLHAYVCQRLLSLFETLAKKYQRLVNELKESQSAKKSDEEPKNHVEENKDGKKGENLNNHKEGYTVDVTDLTSDLVQDVNVLEEVLRMVLEIINSCLSNQLQHNPNLIYALLYKRHIFETFQTHPSFEDIIQNLTIVIDYFSTLLQQYESDLTVKEVLSTIFQGTLRWPSHKLKKFPELKFKYIEEDQPEDFFIPYVWSLVCQNSGLSWDLRGIQMFLPESDP